MTEEPLTPGTDAPPPGRPGLAGRAARHVAGVARGWLASGAVGAAWLWRRRPRGTRAAAQVFTFTVAAAGAWSIAAQASLAERLPHRLDWEAAAALIDRDARAGDAAIVSPAWAERARMVLPARVPLLAGSPGEETLTGARRVWLVSLPGAPGFSFATELALLERAGRSAPGAPLGGLAVERLDVAAPLLPLAFLPDRLSRAQVSIGDLPCAREGVGFRCPGPAAIRVERTVREVGGLPRPCLLAPPDPGAGAPLVLAFADVAVGRTLGGHAGLAGGGAPPSPVRIAVLVDGEEAGAVELPGRGWQPFRIDTSRFAGRARSVTLVLTATTAPGPLCLDAVLLP